MWFFTVHYTVPFSQRLVWDREYNAPTQYHAGPSVCEDIFEMSPIVQLCSFGGAMSPHELLFKDAVLGSDVRDRVHLQPSSGCLHHCQHIALAWADWWRCDVINVPGLLTFIFQPSSPTPKKLYPFSLTDCSACFTVMGNLGYSVHSSVTSPCECCISSLMT